MKKAQEGICGFLGCDNEAGYRCDYCNNLYCKDHASAALLVDLNRIVNEEDNKKRLLLKDEFDKKKSHICVGYTEKFWRDWSNNVVLKKRTDDEKIVVQQNKKITVERSASHNKSNERVIEVKSQYKGMHDKQKDHNDEQPVYNSTTKIPNNKREKLFDKIKDSLGIEE